MVNFSTGLRFLAVTGLLLSASSSFAQPDTGGPLPTTPTPTPDPTAVPLDGGASLLVAAGIGFGIRKLRARSRR
ncbi:hypothetical protein FNT36_10895 [Hymenobacter setariae]|uniref:VPDSG-CTERM sorting domain-containing protein n=1 Tax=Hymenobacter setariae TaxID=2594794 RepID=A0A558BZH1_9BACT|nr:hypothetical protein [Hymenobacter setariae]TVT41918.1 hypothetical protein FNT36_10895 [Hymenobacter setariae]